MKPVLVVEDEIVIRELLEEFLQAEGFAVTTASNGDDALGIIGSGAAFGAVLTDVNMPGSTDGIAVGRFVRRYRPDVRVIYITGRPDLFFECGVPAGHRLITKPFDFRTVVEALGEAFPDAPGSARSQ